MIPTRGLRRLATRSGARQIRNVEIDIILTLLPQMFHERGLLEHLAFKGGTMLRKMEDPGRKPALEDPRST